MRSSFISIKIVRCRFMVGGLEICCKYYLSKIFVRWSGIRLAIRPSTAKTIKYEMGENITTLGEPLKCLGSTK